MRSNKKTGLVSPVFFILFNQLLPDIRKRKLFKKRNPYSAEDITLNLIELRGNHRIGGFLNLLVVCNN